MKKKIFFGILPMLCLFVVMGCYAIVLFQILGHKIDITLRENYRSVVAGQQMKESLERMDSAIFFELVGEDQRGRGIFSENQTLFADALRAEAGNITLPGEQELTDHVSAFFSQYRGLADRFHDLNDPAVKHQLYFEDLLPVATKIRESAQEIVRINENNMLDANHQARARSTQSVRYMTIAMLVGIAACLFFASRLQRAILRPLQELTAFAQELGEGNLDVVVPVQSKDEVGRLADAFNKMAGKLRTYRQATTDQILQARQMTEIAFSAFPDPILACSVDRSVDFLNPAAVRLAEKTENKNSLPPGVREKLDRVLQGGTDYLPTSFDSAVALRIDDREVFFLPRVVGMRDEAGLVFGAAVILQDVTRFRLMDEVKTNLVSTVSHELKTPLTSVRMGLHLLLEEQIGPLNGKQAELLLAAREDSERLLSMINDLLDIARLESGHIDRQLRPIRPEALVNGIASDLRPMVETHGCSLAVKAAPNLPLVRVDETQLKHVFSNLLSNAAKHSKPGQSVQIETRLVPGYVRFSVFDQGPGIPAEFQPRIFERFFRLPDQEQSGAGLGLAIAKEIVVAHGGSIGLRSTVGIGSEFFFDLPAPESSLN